MKKIIFLLLLFASPALAASVTVCDSGGGCNYTTIASAIAAITDGTANTITVQGTYTGNEFVAVNKGGSGVGSEIIIQASGTQTVNGFNIYDSYVIIDGFDITGNITDYLGSISIQPNTSYIIIRNNTVRDTSDNDYQLRTILSGSDLPATYPQHITITGNTFKNSRYPKLSVQCSYCTIAANTFGPSTNDTASDVDAIRFWGIDSVVADNIIVDLRSTGGGHNDPFQTFGNANDWVMSNWIFERNLIYNTVAPESNLTQPCNLSADGNSISGITFRNNIYVNLGGSCASGVPETNWYNNLFFNVTRNTGAVTNYYYQWGCADDACTGSGTLRNNMFVGCGSEDGDNDSRGWWGVAAGAPTPTASNNYVSKKPTSLYAAKSGWNTSNGNLNGGDPGFTDPTNLNFAIASDSILKDAGYDLSAIWANAVDKVMVSRPQGAAWDIGAYEYNAAVSSRSGLAIHSGGMPVKIQGGGLVMSLP